MAKQLLIVYHSKSGATARLVEAALAGARDPAIEGVAVRAISPLEAQPEDVLDSAGVLLATPENFGYMSGAMKHFFDTVYYPCLEHTPGLPYGLIIKAGNDGQGALAAVTRIVIGLRWRLVAEPVIVVGEVSEDRVEACHELGMTLAAGLEAGLF